MPKDSTDENIIIEQDVPESVDAPLDKGSVVGKATIYYKADANSEKQKLAEVNVVAGEKIERSGILYVGRGGGPGGGGGLSRGAGAFSSLTLLFQKFTVSVKERREMLSITAISDAIKV